MPDPTCSACGGDLPGDAGACPHCGIAFRETEAPEPEAPARAAEGAAAAQEAPTGEGASGAIPTYRPLETVLKEERSVVMAVQAGLESMGYETFLADDNIKTIDPFMTGGYAFQVRLLAPRETAAEVRRVIAGIDRERADRQAAEARAQGRDLALEARARGVASLGYLAIACTFGFLFAPFGLFLAGAFFLKKKGLDLPPALTFFTALSAAVDLGVSAWLVSHLLTVFG